MTEFSKGILAGIGMTLFICMLIGFMVFKIVVHDAVYNSLPELASAPHTDATCFRNAAVYMDAIKPGYRTASKSDQLMLSCLETSEKALLDGAEYMESKEEATNNGDKPKV